MKDSTMKNKSLDAQVIICGHGGQGVLFLTRLLDEVAVSLGNDVISSETHGMAMRGGSVVSYVRIGKYSSPLIRTGEADILLALSENELPLYNYLLKPDRHQIYVNSHNRKHAAIDATRVAEQLGSIVVMNLVLLGFACSHAEFPFDYDIVKKNLKKITSPNFIELNITAFTEGYQFAKN